MQAVTAAPAMLPELGALVRQMQSRFLREAEPHLIFDPLLPELLSLSGSEYGFIGEVWRKPDGTPYLKVFTLTNIAWSDEGRAAVERQRREGMEFHNLQTLFGAAVTGDEPVIANQAPRDPRASGTIPHGHPPLDTFLGVPLHYGGERVGVIGLANRRPGYDQALLLQLDPLFHAVAGIIAAVQLDRERRGAQQALADSERRYRATFELAAVGIAHLSLDGRLIEVNDRYCEFVGRSRPALIGRHWAEITHPDDVEADRAGRMALVRGEIDRHQIEKRYLRPDGGVLWAQVAVALAPGSGGRPDHFITVLHDLSGRRAAQEARVAAEAAERANSAKTEFLSRMSHELRTPLNAVQGFAQLLQLDPAQPLTEPQRQKVRHIERAGRHLLAMINDVLDLSRIEAGQLQVQCEPVDLQRLVADVRALLDGAAAAAGVRVSVSPDNAPGQHAMADRLRLRQVLVNLISNAIKYNRRGGEVHVAWRLAGGGTRVQLDVSDTGVGLTPEQIAHLFEPFNRLGAERNSVDGTGIGLVITRRLLELMGGGLEVHSRPQRGSRFRVALPAPLDASRTSTLDTLPGALDAGGAHHRSVLYAEDNASNVELVRQVFSLRPTWELRVARNGTQALRMLDAAAGRPAAAGHAPRRHDRPGAACTSSRAIPMRVACRAWRCRPTRCPSACRRPAPPAWPPT